MWNRLFEGFKILCRDFDQILKKKRGNYSRDDIAQGTREILNMHRLLDFCQGPGPARKKSNVPKLKSS
jgi:hypothetical protein